MVSIPFGVPRTIFKWDGRSQRGDQILLQDVLNMGPGHELDLEGFTDDMLLFMCILSGCDYLSQVRIPRQAHLSKRLSSAIRRE